MTAGRLVRSKEDRTIDIAVYVISTIVLLAVAYPLIYVLSSSFSEPKAITLGQVYLLPKGFTLEGYMKIFEYKPIWTGYRNTLFYTVLGTSINMALTLTSAYALSRRDLKGRNVITFLMTFTLFFSGGLLPTYLVVMKLHMVNTFWALLLPNAVSMWYVIIARTYFQTTIPNELNEAAFIDGCTNFKLFLRIVLPLSKPIIAVLTLFYAVGHWNSYFNALIYLSDQKLYPLQLILRNILVMDQMVDMMGLDADALQDLVRRMELKEAMKFGIIIISSLPLLILYPFLQKYFVKGVMVGAVKG